LSSGSKIRNNSSKPGKENKNLNINSNRNSKNGAKKNYDLPLNRNQINITNDYSLGGNQKKKNLRKQWKGDQLILDELDKLYKKVPSIDRLEWEIDFSSEFKEILNI